MVVNALTKTGKWMLYLLAALLILIALLAASVRLAIFYSEDYSEQLASLVGNYVGSPVEIGKVDLVWNRFDASASLKDVKIQSADGAETLLELPQIELQLNVRDMLLERNLSVRSVQLNNLSLAARYEGQGKLRMLGKGLRQDALSGDSKESDGASQSEELGVDDLSDRSFSVLSWLFNAERIAILDSDITLTDALRNREYKVDRVNIRAFNDGDLHQIRVSSALPGEIGEDSLASFDFTGQADDINAWKGQFYINTKGLKIGQLSEFWGQNGHQLTGTTDVQLWGKWSGTRVNELRGIAAAPALALRSPASVVTSISGRNVDVDFNWTRRETGWGLKFNRITGLLNDNEVRFDGMDIQVERVAEKRNFALSGPDIDLHALKPLYSYIDSLLPENSAFKTQSVRGGDLKNWFVSGVSTSDKVVLTQLQVDAEGLAMDSLGPKPGVSGLSAKINFKDGVGRAVFDNQDVQLVWPEFFDQPLPVVNVDGDIRFSNVLANGAENSAQLWKFAADDLRLSSLDLNTSATFTLAGQDDGQRLIDLHTTILNANLSNLKNYYPTRVMKPKILAWLQTALVAGDVVRGRVEVKGDLTNFAPATGSGHFYAESDLVNATLKFRPDWPAVREMDGNLTFSARAMRGRVYQGSIRDAQFSDARLFIPDLKSPVLEMQTNAIGPLADMLDFAQTGPLSAKIGKLFGGATGNGTSRLALDLRVPLKKSLRDRLAVDGEVVLDNAQITARTFGVDLQSATGVVRFNRSGLLIDDLLVRYQGLPLKVTATQTSNAGLDRNQLRIKGPVAISSVMRSYRLPLVERFEGISDWNIDIDVSRRGVGSKARVEFTARSDLSGTEFKLPVPLQKNADELHEVELYRDFNAAEKDWWLELPGLIKARMRVGDDKKLESMAIALGKSENTVLPWRGIALHGDAQRIDALGWLRLAMGFQSQREPGGEAFPLFAKVSTRQMLLGEQEMDDLVYIAYRDGTHQVHRVESAVVSGDLMLRRNPNSDEPLVLRLDRLDKRLLVALAAAEGKNTTNLVTDQTYDPRTIPALDMSVKELKWDNWRFSRVRMRSRPTEQGMKISALTAKQDGMRISGSGFWNYFIAGGLGAHATSIDLNASFDNFGAAITAIGGGQSFGQGKGEAALSLSWPGAAYRPQLRQMSGQLLFNLRDGRILSVEPGAGRILGLFALQALPRRLTFDFRDITNTGLEYTSIGGNLSIADGLARANAIAVTGPVAEILILGSTNFIAQTYDQTIDVLPRVSGALPLLGVLSGGPAAGLTALLADGFLKGIGVNLDEIGRRRYTLTGNWDKPVWTTVNVANNGN